MMEAAKAAAAMNQKDDVKVPKVLLQDSFVRGHGTVLTLTQSLPFEFASQNSLVALFGSMVVINGELAEYPDPPGKGKIKFQRTTACLTDHLVLLNDKKNGNGLLRTEVDAAQCLFSAAAAQPLVQLNGLASKELRERRFGWGGEGRNAYCGYEKKVMSQQPPDFMFSTDTNKVDWQMISGEAYNPGTRFVPKSLEFKFPEDDFARILPRTFADKISQLQLDFPAEEFEPLTNYGSSLESLQTRVLNLDHGPFPVIDPSIDDLIPFRP
jgi:hypothetical protein